MSIFQPLRIPLGRVFPPLLVGTAIALGLLAGIDVGWHSDAARAADTDAPVLVAFDITPTTIDVSTTVRTVTLTAEVVDGVGGAGVSGSSYIELYAPVNPYTVRSQWILLRIDDAHRTSGTAQDGIYQQVLTVPAYSAAGLW